MRQLLPVLMGVDWNEAGTGHVSVWVDARHLEDDDPMKVGIGSRVFVVETEEMLGDTGTVVDMVHSSHPEYGEWIAVVQLDE